MYCDVFCFLENGFIFDIGIVVIMLEMIIGCKLYCVFGKLNLDFLNLIFNEDWLEKDDLLMIGDCIYIDI